MELRPGSITQHSQGQDAYQRSSGFAFWGAMSLPVGEMASLGATIAGHDLTPPKNTLTLHPCHRTR